MSPNIKVINILAGKVDVKVSEVRQQLETKGKVRIGSVRALCDLTEQFLAEHELQEKKNGS